MELKLLQELKVSAASGLVKIGSDCCIVADDENSLFILKADGSWETVALFPGELPAGKEERKKVKPDLEALCLFEDTLLAFPSGSTERRMTGAWFNAQTQAKGAFSLEALYSRLGLADLNIEGAAFARDELWLFQRGNGAKGKNAIVMLDKNLFLQELKTNSISVRSLKRIKEMDLGKLQGLSLGFTDACAAEDKVYFLAAAEDTVSTYEDGQFMGGVLGEIDRLGNIVRQVPVPFEQKPEGLWWDGKDFYVVTDADDRSQPSRLYRLRPDPAS